MIRVCHLITGLNIGGAEVNLANLVARLDRTRFAQRVVSMIEPGPVGARIRDAGIPLTSLHMSRGRAGPRDLWRAIADLRRERPDILQCWMYHADLLGLVAGRIAGVPRIAWNLRCSFMRGGGVKSPLLALLGAMSALPDAVVVNSNAGKAVHETLGYRPRHWAVIPNGVDTEHYTPRPAERAVLRERLGLAADELALGLVARLDPMKDHPNFFAAAKRVAAQAPQARFLVIGSGCTADSALLRGLIREAGLEDKVRLLGPRLDLESLYPALDLLVLSSAYGEGFPTVLIEALACGVPCVATDVGDAAAIIGPAGAIVPPSEPEALAAAIVKVMLRGRDAYAAEARTRAVTLFGLERMADAYESLYQELAVRRPARAAE